MQTGTRRIVIGVLGLWLAVGVVSRADDPAGGPDFIALGDSIDSGKGANGSGGWARLFDAHLVSVLGRPVELRNHAVSGAGMRDILRNQLPLATLELEARAPQPVVVTIGGGGNDLVRFVSSPEAASCLAGEADCLPRVDALLGGIEQRFEQALRELRRAGGPGTLILVRTQYNPLYRVGCKTPELRDLADTTLEGSAGSRLERGLNDRLRDVAARQDAKVIEVYALFRAAPDALVGPDCAHPSEAGHAAIFAAAVAAFERATFGPSSGGAATVSSH